MSNIPNRKLIVKPLHLGPYTKAIILPAWCKQLRDEEGYWKSVEDYISQNTGAGFTHGMCPSCQKKYYAELF